MSTPLWMAIEPRRHETLLLLSASPFGTALKARLPALPADPRAAMLLLESLSAWYRRPLVAALDADELAGQHHAVSWTELLAQVPGLDLSIEWVSRSRRPVRDRFFDAIGDMRSSKRLLSVAATGQR